MHILSVNEAVDLARSENDQLDIRLSVVQDERSRHEVEFADMESQAKEALHEAQTCSVALQTEAGVLRLLMEELRLAVAFAVPSTQRSWLLRTRRVRCALPSGAAKCWPRISACMWVLAARCARSSKACTPR